VNRVGLGENDNMGVTVSARERRFADAGEPPRRPLRNAKPARAKVAHAKPAQLVPGVLLPFAALTVASCGQGITPDLHSQRDASPTIDLRAVDRAGTLASEVATGALAPSDLPSVALWLDAATGVTTGAGGAVMSWADRSPNGHIAFPARVGPTLSADAWRGQPGVRFAMSGADNQRLVIADHASLRWGTGDFAVGAVIAYENQPDNSDVNGTGLVYSKQTLPAPYPGPALFANDGTVNPERTAFLLQVQYDATSIVSSDTTGYNDGKFHVVFGLRRDMTLIIRVDGVVVGRKLIGSVVDISIPGTDVTIGAAAGGGEQQLTGTILQLCAFAGPIEDADLEAVERYFRARHDLP